MAHHPYAGPQRNIRHNYFHIRNPHHCNGVSGHRPHRHVLKPPPSSDAVMTYTPTVYEDAPSTDTPLSAANLNKAENALAAQDARITILEASPGATSAGVVNVRNYGVVGDGTDESTGIVNARNAVLN